MKSYIRVKLSHFKDDAYVHYTQHTAHFKEFARTVESDWENSVKHYNQKAQTKVRTPVS